MPRSCAGERACSPRAECEQHELVALALLEQHACEAGGRGGGKAVATAAAAPATHFLLCLLWRHTSCPTCLLSVVS